MKQKDIRIGGTYLTLVSEVETAVIVTSIALKDRFDTKTRFTVKRADTGAYLPKARTAAAFRGEVKAPEASPLARLGLRPATF